MNENFRKARTERNLTQQDVANALGITRVTYIRYENGEREISFELAKALAKFYNVSLDYLAGIIDEERPLT